MKTNLRTEAPEKPGSWASSEAARRSMTGNRGRDSKPEIAVRSALHRAGFRFRKNYRPVMSSRAVVDVAFTRWKLAVEIDGCFWHGCPAHGSIPVTNTEYWSTKLGANRERDMRHVEELAREGWTLLRFWEHESPSAIVQTISLNLHKGGDRP